MMDFSLAMQNLLAGKRVRRADWNRPLCVFKATTIFADKQVPGVWMEMKNGLVGAYTPSQCDMLASDWQLLPNELPKP